MANLGSCEYCNVELTEGSGSGFIAPGQDFMAVLQKASARKFVCPSCQSQFCLTCGNNKGTELKTGSTHCPKCGTKVL